MHKLYRVILQPPFIQHLHLRLPIRDLYVMLTLCFSSNGPAGGISCHSAVLHGARLDHHARDLQMRPDLLLKHSRESVVTRYWIHKTEDG